jgi:hypothetical protein
MKVISTDVCPAFQFMGWDDTFVRTVDGVVIAVMPALIEERGHKRLASDKLPTWIPIACRYLKNAASIVSTTAAGDFPKPGTSWRVGDALWLYHRRLGLIIAESTDWLIRNHVGDIRVVLDGEFSIYYKPVEAT